MSQKGLLGAILIGQHLVTSDQLEECLKLQQVQKEKLGSLLVEKGYVRERDLIKSLTIQEKFPLIPIDFSLINEEATLLISYTLATKYSCIPLQRQENSLTVAMADPLDFRAIDDIRFQCGLDIKPVFANKDEIAAAIAFFYKGKESAALPSTQIFSKSDPLEVDQIDHLEYGTAEYLVGEEDPGISARSETSLTPVIRMQNMIIEEALKSRASDIHIEPRAKFVQIRNRIDGWLVDTIQVPKWMQESLLSRLKIQASMDISEKRLPQDSSFSVKKDEAIIDLRVSTLPTKYGEKMVIRILDKSQGLLSLRDLGLYSKQMTLVKSIIEKPQGLILVVGPTGSGKTTSLYAMINTIKSEALNIVTIEDPIEYELEGINQVQVNEKAGLSFATILRSILRQDPDVILVGEIRDQETANIALRAAFTGHLVLSTLHTNDTVSTITRLCNIGIEPYIIASSLLAVISQRLVRKNCPHCQEPYEPSEEVLQKFPIAKKTKGIFSRGKGCSICNNKGYLGREGFYEIMTINAKMKDAIANRASETALRRLAIEQGMVPLINEGFRKAKKGLVNLEEILRVIATTEESLSTCYKCGEHLDIDFLVCPYCETMLIRKCYSCHRVLQTGWTVCPYCGKMYIEPHKSVEQISQ